MMQRLGDTVSRRRGRRHHHTNGTLQARLNQAGDIRRNRGGKEQRLSLHRQRIKNLIDLWRKSHIEHTVGFIQHQNLNRGQD